MPIKQVRAGTAAAAPSVDMPSALLNEVMKGPMTTAPLLSGPRYQTCRVARGGNHPSRRPPACQIPHAHCRWQSVVTAAQWFDSYSFEKSLR